MKSIIKWSLLLSVTLLTFIFFLSIFASANEKDNEAHKFSKKYSLSSKELHSLLLAHDELKNKITKTDRHGVSIFQKEDNLIFLFHDPTFDYKKNRGSAPHIEDYEVEISSELEILSSSFSR